MNTFLDLNEKVYGKKVSIAQRRKQARRMRMLSKQTAFKMKKKRTMMRVRSAEKIGKAARKQTINKFRLKVYPNYHSMSMMAKIKADQIVMQRFGKRIEKISKRAAIKLRQGEHDRVKKFRAGLAAKSAPVKKTPKLSTKSMVAKKITRKPISHFLRKGSETQHKQQYGAFGGRE